MQRKGGLCHSLFVHVPSFAVVPQHTQQQFLQDLLKVCVVVLVFVCLCVCACAVVCGGAPAHAAAVLAGPS
jgi:hypothetical protein